MAGDQVGGFGDEGPVALSVVGKREIDTGMHASVAEVSVDQAVEAVLGHESLELAQVGGKMVGWDGGVLPAGPGGVAGRGAATQTGAVFADTPHKPGGRSGDDERVEAMGVGDEPPGGVEGVGFGVTGGLDEQPAATLGQLGHCGVATATTQHLDQAGVHAFQGDRVVREQAAGVLGRGDHVGVAEDGQRDRTWGAHEVDGGGGDHAQRALGAGQEAGQVGAAFREQVLEGISGDLATETAELSADHLEPARDDAP